MIKIPFLYIAVVMTVLFQTAIAHASVSSIVIDAESGSVLYANNADERRYPASLTKLMTLYITFNALENNTLKLDDELKISHTAANRSPSRLNLTPGKTIDVRTAILGTIVKSANDCATVLGEALAKDERSFAILMTQTAKKLGMKNTTFKNASGLQHSKQKTTARDMAILAAALYHHFPQYYSWFSIPSFEYNGKTYKTHNFLLKNFEGADGMKTGFTAAAGYNIVTSAKRGNHRVIAVTMGHNQQETRDKTVYAMMDKTLDNMDAAKQVDSKRLFAEINKNVPKTTKVKLASAGTYLPKTSKNGKWAVQVGSFGNYGAAQKHAQKIKNKLAGKFSVRGIDIEKFNLNGQTMYRSKLIGMNKNEAGKACRLLQKNRLSCMVTTYRAKTAYAQK